MIHVKGTLTLNELVYLKKKKGGGIRFFFGLSVGIFQRI